MLKQPFRIALVIGALFVLPLAVSACGGEDVPGNAVAVVDGQPITKAEYARWYAINGKTMSQQGGAAVLPDPPTYAKCIAALRKTEKPAKGKPKSPDATLKKQCQDQEKQLKEQTLSFLIGAKQIAEEAKSLKVNVTPAEIAAKRKQLYPTDKAFKEFLKTSGMSAQDYNLSQRTQELVTKITEKAKSEADPVTNAQISSYYAKNKSQFDQPERRDIEIVLAGTEAEAEKAKKAIEKGESWKAVAKQYSEDPSAKSSDGLLTGIDKASVDTALGTSAFGAKRGKLIGPVESPFGWYVLRVKKVTPGKVSSLAQSKEQVKMILTEELVQKEFERYAKDYEKRWTEKTICGEDYRIPQCGNAPKQDTTTTAAGGGGGDGSGGEPRAPQQQ